MLALMTNTKISLLCRVGANGIAVDTCPNTLDNVAVRTLSPQNFRPIIDAGRGIVSAEQPTVIYTLTDEAPLLATYAFLPIVRAFAEPAGIESRPATSPWRPASWPSSPIT